MLIRSSKAASSRWCSPRRCLQRQRIFDRHSSLRQRLEIILEAQIRVRPKGGGRWQRRWREPPYGRGRRAERTGRSPYVAAQRLGTSPTQCETAKLWGGGLPADCGLVWRCWVLARGGFCLAQLQYYSARDGGRKECEIACTSAKAEAAVSLRSIE